MFSPYSHPIFGNPLLVPSEYHVETHLEAAQARQDLAPTLDDEDEPVLEQDINTDTHTPEADALDGSFCPALHAALDLLQESSKPSKG